MQFIFKNPDNKLLIIDYKPTVDGNKEFTYHQKCNNNKEFLTKNDDQNNDILNENKDILENYETIIPDYDNDCFYNVGYFIMMIWDGLSIYKKFEWFTVNVKVKQKTEHLNVL